MKVPGLQMWSSSANAKVGRSVTAAPCADSEEPGMPRIRLFLAVTLLVLSCASCSRDPGPSRPNSRPSMPTVSSSPTPTIPPYLASYDSGQRSAYDEALRAHSAFVEHDRQFAAAGKTTKEAAAFYRHNSIDWVSDWAALSQLANNHVTVTGSTIVKWVRPVSIDLEGTGPDVVVLNRCVDSANLVVTQAGKKLDQPNLKVPHVFRVRVEKRSAETWWRVSMASSWSPLVAN